MATPEFVYQDPLPIQKDTTKYRLLTKEHVSVTQFEGKEILKVAPRSADVSLERRHSRCVFLIANRPS